MYGDDEEQALVFEVTGLTIKSKELDYLYKLLLSLHGQIVGGEYWTEVEEYLSKKHVKLWINNLIDSLKKEGWADYVKTNLDIWYNQRNKAVETSSN
jgi:hypothetical protein